MKTYSVEIYRYSRHGQHGADYEGLAVWSVEANNKKEAKEIALENMIGMLSKDFGDHGFPIDFEHAPEATESEFGGLQMSYQATQTHVINEYDIRCKNIVVDVTVQE